MGKAGSISSSKTIAEKQNAKNSKKPKPGFMTEEQTKHTILPKKRTEQNARKADTKPTLLKNMPARKQPTKQWIIFK